MCRNFNKKYVDEGEKIDFLKIVKDEETKGVLNLFFDLLRKDNNKYTTPLDGVNACLNLVEENLGKIKDKLSKAKLKEKDKRIFEMNKLFQAKLKKDKRIFEKTKKIMQEFGAKGFDDLKKLVEKRGYEKKEKLDESLPEVNKKLSFVLTFDEEKYLDELEEQERKKNELLRKAEEKEESELIKWKKEQRRREKDKGLRRILRILFIKPFVELKRIISNLKRKRSMKKAGNILEGILAKPVKEEKRTVLRIDLKKKVKQKKKEAVVKHKKKKESRKTFEQKMRNLRELALDVIGYSRRFSMRFFEKIEGDEKRKERKKTDKDVDDIIEGRFQEKQPIDKKRSVKVAGKTKKKSLKL